MCYRANIFKGFVMRNVPKLYTIKQSALVLRPRSFAAGLYVFLWSGDFSYVCKVKRDYGAKVFVHTELTMTVDGG